ncbi:MAG: SprT family zinc-dependent metalloprotease [Bacteroidetes bacterium]|nr:SprT family zinc-dependent metalloprotease [Bacteroidota bacterium]
MNEVLESLWIKINSDFFDGKLHPLAEIEWVELSGENGIGAHGRYVPQSMCIMIDSRFEPDKIKLRHKDKTEEAKLEVSYRLLVHEMVHQALHEKNAPNPGGHGKSFLEEAHRVSKILEVPPPNISECSSWPELRGLIVKFKI